MNRAKISPVEPNDSLADQIYDLLRAALISGEMAPGIVYSVPHLAKRFNVSATPVREALLALGNQGLVAPVKNKGFRVQIIDEAQLDQIMQVRQMLEVPSIIRVSQLASASDLARFRETSERILSYAEMGQVTKYVEADRVLHLDMLRLSGNDALVGIVDDLRAQTRLLGLSSLAHHGLLKESAEEHLQLIDAMAEKDELKIQAMMEQHLGHIRGIWSDHPEREPSR